MGPLKVVDVMSALEFADPLFQKLAEIGPRPTEQMPQFQWKHLIATFDVCWGGPSAEGAAEAPRPRESYAAFLAKEGKGTPPNPYKQLILNTPVQFSVEDVYDCHVVYSYKLVETLQQLEDIVDTILNEGRRIVALDVEHCNEFSYRGMTCLVQLATPTATYLIDPFRMFTQMHLLNKITLNADILKVLHNAEHDVAWLQRDFGVYIVNAFDAGIAATVLNFPGGSSLQNLLKQLCAETKCCAFAREDWSQRPIPDHLLEYAAQDVRHLLFIHRVFARRLSDFVQFACEQADHAAISRYESLLKQRFSKTYNFSAYKLKHDLKDLRSRVPEKMTDLLVLAFAWRDIMARFLDVGRHYLIPKNCIPNIVKRAWNGSSTPLKLSLHGHLESRLERGLYDLLRAFCDDQGPQRSILAVENLASEECEIALQQERENTKEGALEGRPAFDISI
ncbi:hypothetical protein Esti_004722 [Eimeria stiedai]